MHPDTQIILHELEPRTIRVWVCGDVHVGDEKCQLKEWGAWLKEINESEDDYVIFLGDLMNCTTKKSVSDIFSDKLTPREQQKVIFDALYPLAQNGKILAMVMGNHEWRVGKESSIDPLYDVAVQLGIDNVYRKNFASVRVKMTGAHEPNNKRNNCVKKVYDILAFHGASDLKTRNMANNIEGWDALCTGHVHDPKVEMPAHLCVTTAGNIITKEIVRVVGCSWLDYGGYAARAMYLPKVISRPQALVLEWRNSNSVPKRVGVEW